MSSHKNRLHSITAVIVVDLVVPDTAVFHATAKQLAVLADDSEILIVANGVNSIVATALSNLISEIGDATVHFLAEPVDNDVATLIGFDRSLGDVLVVMTPTVEELEALPALLTETHNSEIVFAVPTRARNSTANHFAGGLFFKAYKALMGVDIVWPTPRLRLYSRAAARYLASRLDGPFLMKAVHIRGAFPGIIVPVSYISDSSTTRGLSGSLKKAFRNVMSASTMPLRLAIGFAGLGAFMAVLETIYVLAINVTRSDVQPGWTTLSLLIACMMFIFSLLLALLTSYILAMYTTIQPRSRVPVVRELRSQISRNVDRLNVLGEDGRFKLGASGVLIPAIRPSDPPSQ